MLVLIFIIYNLHFKKASFGLRIILSFCHRTVLLSSKLLLTRFNRKKLLFFCHNYVNCFVVVLF